MIINRQSCVVIDLTPMSKINVSEDLWGFLWRKTGATSCFPANTVYVLKPEW